MWFMVLCWELLLLFSQWCYHNIWIVHMFLFSGAVKCVMHILFWTRDQLECWWFTILHAYKKRDNSLGVCLELEMMRINLQLIISIQDGPLPVVSRVLTRQLWGWNNPSHPFIRPFYRGYNSSYNYILGSILYIHIDFAVGLSAPAQEQAPKLPFSGYTWHPVVLRWMHAKFEDLGYCLQNYMHWLNQMESHTHTQILHIYIIYYIKGILATPPKATPPRNKG